MSRRTDRIGSQLIEELARLLRADVTDPRIRLVTLTRIDVSPDLRNAIVYFSTLGPETEKDIESIDDGLSSASPFLRHRAAQVLPWKRMPELRFRYDPSISLGSKTLDLLREIEEDAPSESTDRDGR